MGTLVDHQIKAMGTTLLDPFDPTMVQPASVDVRLSNQFYVSRFAYAGDIISPSTASDDTFFPMFTVGGCLVLGAEDFALGCTIERITLPSNVLGRFDGKSSLGRLGLLTHITAGFIDPGFSGQITVELKNVNRAPIKLYPGMKIGQVSFEMLDSAADMPYGSSDNGSHYQDQTGPQLSRGYEGFTLADIP